MKIKIRSAKENNLKNLDVLIEDGLTAITGVSGSGKTSLIIDTLYHEARRRFLETFSKGREEFFMIPAKVRSINGIGPTISLEQNVLNRNPNSTLASATGLIPLLKILYARFGQRFCHVCGTSLMVLTPEEIIKELDHIKTFGMAEVYAPLVSEVCGSHKTLLELLSKEFDTHFIIVDGNSLESSELNPNLKHSIEIKIGSIDETTTLKQLREILDTVSALGANALLVKSKEKTIILSRVSACATCGTWYSYLEPPDFNKKCPYCKGKGCKKCNHTGLIPIASRVSWAGLTFIEILSKSVKEALSLFQENHYFAPNRIKNEIEKRLNSLSLVGLDYLTLDRISPTLSRGESQRVRLSLALLNQLEDITHILDEPTIGQHYMDVKRLLPVLRKLKGSVICIEHDKQAVAAADSVIDIGPGAGDEGGEIIFKGIPRELWNSQTPSGLYFSGRKSVTLPKMDHPSEPKEWIIIKNATRNNLKSISIKIPLNRLTCITGVSGSGKSTLAEEVLFPSLKQQKPIGCKNINGLHLKPIIVDQGPIGKNPRSNPATYTKIADIIRKLFAKVSKLDATSFSFNTKQGQCSTCNGMGANEIKMKFLPSNWIECPDCEGQRFSEEILETRIDFEGEGTLSIAEFFDLPISKVSILFEKETRLSEKSLEKAKKMLRALTDIGLGYMSLGQPSPTLSGGEAQRIKLAKYLGKKTLKNQLFILDEPSTGLHPQDLSGLLIIFGKLVSAGATIVIVEHNLDIIKAADWIVDLGPQSGPKGGEVVYQGSLKALSKIKNSLTAQALQIEQNIKPRATKVQESPSTKDYISIKNAHIHNLNISVKIPKHKLVVVTGVSGSGKSSLIIDTLEKEAHRRYLETLSMYERQSTKETSEALVDKIEGLGITASISAEKIRRSWMLNLRNTVGIITNLEQHLAKLISYLGTRKCPKCNQRMARTKKGIFYCAEDDLIIPIPKPRHFISSNYSAACLKCHGVGSYQIPNPSKLIIQPDKPLCRGAMHSPGFFPKGYLCKPYNVGYYIVQALANRYGFDQFNTPWNKMTKEAHHAFLYGDEKPLIINYENKKGQKSTKELHYLGFYEQWLRDWDVGGTYTDKRICEECDGTKLRPKYTKVSLFKYSMPELLELSLEELYSLFINIELNDEDLEHVEYNLTTTLKRLSFLIRTGLGYIHLNRVVETLSAGEAQRIKLAGLLGGELTSLTVLLDEPSRGLHPSELEALIEVLEELRDMGNTVIVIEHDFLFMEHGDYIIDMGPGAGAKGGKIVAEGTLEDIKNSNSLTALWLTKKKKFNFQKKDIVPKKWLTITEARHNNLKIDKVEIPLGFLTGICGISGSGKSTLIIDTLGRALAPKKHTTSVSREIITPGKYDTIEGKLAKTIIIDQAKKKIKSPLKYLNLETQIRKVFADSEDAKILHLSIKDLAKRCTVCKGKGCIKIDMQFLPDIYEQCDVCKGSGLLAESRNVKYNGVSLAEVNDLTINEAIAVFHGHQNIITKLKVTQEIGLEYLHLNQPARSLSGGEIQRLKIAKQLMKKSRKNTLYILDEPSIGQHIEDLSKLIKSLKRLVAEEHTVIVIEHHPHLLASCDWLIELGPGAGAHGGKIIDTGTPETLSKKGTPTAPYIKKVLEAIK
ncbi:MAG: hypothetical protein BAJALOKI1v1_30044 [Promethearchaeota archaeon]|nr:MAG: hypothetical protein BAJALOKI1v1_30044 [Candidatus Lokiarchaeota archaeon]